MNNEFWQLIEEYQVQIPDLSLALNAPIKVLCRWSREGAPDEAFKELKKFLGLDDED